MVIDMDITFKVCNGEGRIEGVDTVFYPLGITEDSGLCSLFGSRWNAEELYNQFRILENSVISEFESDKVPEVIDTLLSNKTLSYKGYGYKIHSVDLYETDYNTDIKDINEVRLPYELGTSLDDSEEQEGYICVYRKRKDSRRSYDIIENAPLVTHWITLDAYYLYVARII